MPADHRQSEDRDTAAKYYAVGPGRRRRTRGPVIAAYADGAIDRHCSNCGATPLSFCHHPDGTERKIPCPKR